ncbi:hypothetical protein C2W62_08240 [Candidatus Entotheonella serta]|nr:hypothetical protein C2W62_08240 [Candidatus Entotheonella serta]
MHPELALSDLRGFEGTIRHYNCAIDLDSGSWYASNRRGMACRALGQREAAEQDDATVKALLAGSSVARHYRIDY